jgi:uncharacterized membrane-anchored protein
MSRLDPEQPTLRLPAMQPAGLQEDATLVLPAARRATNGAGQVARHALAKVPEVTLFFWVVKLLTTALGESTSDYLVHTIDPVIAVILGGIGFVAAMVLQFMVRRYIAWVYWFAVVMVALFGTMCADVVHIVLHVPYAISASTFAVALAVIFIVWYRTEHTLSIHSIYTPRREVFYWLTVITTFALGTATGDLAAYTFKLGFFSSGLIFIALFAVPALAYFLFRLNEIVAFWWAYILTRPIGASFADWTGKLPQDGGIGLGQARTSLIVAVLIIGCVAYLVITCKDVQEDHQ